MKIYQSIRLKILNSVQNGGAVPKKDLMIQSASFLDKKREAAPPILWNAAEASGNRDYGSLSKSGSNIYCDC